MRIKANETASKPAAKRTTAKKTVSPVGKKGKVRRVDFSVRAGEGSKVFLAGSFNAWDPTAKKMVDKAGDGVFTVTISLPVDTYEYKFVIDGIWCVDPECTEWVQNELGTLNSVKRVE